MSSQITCFDHETEKFVFDDICYFCFKPPIIKPFKNIKQDDHYRWPQLKVDNREIFTHVSTLFLYI